MTHPVMSPTRPSRSPLKPPPAPHGVLSLGSLPSESLPWPQLEKSLHFLRKMVFFFSCLLSSSPLIIPFSALLRKICFILYLLLYLISLQSSRLPYLYLPILKFSWISLCRLLSPILQFPHSCTLQSPIPHSTFISDRMKFTPRSPPDRNCVLFTTGLSAVLE